MRNVIILGSGRGGTSMVAGSLAKAGYFMGDNLMSASPSNPRGFFEDVRVNSLNEDLLEHAAAGFRSSRSSIARAKRPSRDQRWLIELPTNTLITAPHSLVPRIKEFVKREPYCFKDPRFCYTLPAWQPYLRNVVIVVVFRHPMETARSIVKECHDEPRLRNLHVKTGRALRVWQAMFARVLHLSQDQDNWLFLEYQQVLRGEGMQRLADATGAPVDAQFPTRTLHRNVSRERLHGRNRRLFSTLCERTNTSPAGNAG